MCVLLGTHHTTGKGEVFRLVFDCLFKRLLRRCLRMPAGQAHGHAQSKTDDLIQSTKDSANAARDKTADATQSAKESAQDSNEQSASFLQQTGEQMVNMAQGAVDTMKNTLGMNEKK